MTTGLESVIPDNTRFHINMHYQSDSTGEYATFSLNKNMPIETALAMYAKLCPIECNTFLREIHDQNAALDRSSGMSQAGMIMALGRVPVIVWRMLDFLEPGFFEGAERVRNFRRFIRAFPKFSIGDHTLRSTKGVIIK